MPLCTYLTRSRWIGQDEVVPFRDELTTLGGAIRIDASHQLYAYSESCVQVTTLLSPHWFEFNRGKCTMILCYSHSLLFSPLSGCAYTNQTRQPCTWLQFGGQAKPRLILAVAETAATPTARLGSIPILPHLCVTLQRHQRLKKKRIISFNRSEI